MARPRCDECGIELHRFAGAEGNRFVEGWSCDRCGWTWDDEKEDEVEIATVEDVVAAVLDKAMKLKLPPPGRELDALVALKMGWASSVVSNVPEQLSPPGGDGSKVKLCPCYSTDLGACAEVIEKFQLEMKPVKEGWAARRPGLRTQPEGCMPGLGHMWYHCYTLTEAICKAAILG